MWLEANVHAEVPGVRFESLGANRARLHECVDGGACYFNVEQVLYGAYSVDAKQGQGDKRLHTPHLLLN
jgi:hypothetical protein